MIPTVRLKMLAILVLVFAVVFPFSFAHASLKLDSSFSVSERYTDNLFFSFANKRDDFGTIITPRATLTFTNKHVRLAGTYVASAQFYVNNDNANTVSQNTNFNIDLPFLNRIDKRLEVRVNESFNLTPEQPGFSANNNLFGSARGAGVGGGAGGGGAGGGNVGAGGQGAGVGNIGGGGGLTGNSLNNQGIFNSRGTTSFQNRARVRVGYNFTPRWEGNVQYANTFRGGFQESMSHAIRTGLSFGITQNTKLIARYSLRFTEFNGGGTASSNPQAPGGSGSSTSHTINLGARHELTPTISINGRGGVAFSKTVVGTSRLNFNGGGGITKTFPDGQISFRFNQRIGAGGGLAVSTTINQNVVLTASKTITRYISGFLNFGYGRNRSLAGRAISNDAYQFQGGGNLRILEWLSGGVTYSYINQDSNGQFGRSAQSNSIFVGLTATADTFTLFK